MNFRKRREEPKAMAVPEINIEDELLPEIGIEITPCKLTDNVRVDLFRLDEKFLAFLVQEHVIPDDVHNDVQVIAAAKVSQFCRNIRDAYRTFKLREY